MQIDRRSFVLAATATAWAPRAAWSARSVTDSAGRVVALPDTVSKIFAAGGPASVAVYVLRPDALIGWPRALRDEEKPYVLPAVRALPEVGLLTGRGDSVNIEGLLKVAPDVVVDFGSVRPTFVSLADSVQARSGLPYVLVDGRLEATASSLRLLGDMLGVSARGRALADFTDALLGNVDRVVAAIPEEKRPRVYLARGPEGLETGLKGSINTEIIERAGGRNVAVSDDIRRGIVNVSPEQILLWDPDVIITWDRNFHAKLQAQSDPVWQSVRAVRAQRVHLAPTAPFGWIDRPPSLNRLIGLQWLAGLFHGDRLPFDFARDTRAFYKLFYQVDISDADLATLVAWADGKPPAGVRGR